MSNKNLQIAFWGLVIMAFFYMGARSGLTAGDLAAIFAFLIKIAIWLIEVSIQYLLPIVVIWIWGSAIVSMIKGGKDFPSEGEAYLLWIFAAYEIYLLLKNNSFNLEAIVPIILNLALGAFILYHSNKKQEDKNKKT